MNGELTYTSRRRQDGDDFTFGNQDLYLADSLHVEDCSILAETAGIPRVEPIDNVDYFNAIDDINVSWRVLRDSRHSGQQFEIAEANLNADPTAGVDIELSTFSSSISNNVGNAVEFAEHAALNPNRRRVYVASFGNGKTSYWTKEEQAYIKAGGRFTDIQGAALPTIAALARVLEEAELPITRATTNSAGGAYATALMQALPEGQVTHAYIKSRPNITDHSFRAAWGANILIGDLLDDRKLGKASNDPWKMTGEMTEAAKAYMPRIYSQDDAKNIANQFPEDTKTHGLKKMWDDMTALSRGGSKGICSPAAIDTVVALKQQPEAQMTYHFPTGDRLYRSRDDVDNFLLAVSIIGHAATDHLVEALIMPGSHRDHTAYPALRWSVETHAFDK